MPASARPYYILPTRNLETLTIVLNRNDVDRYFTAPVADALC